MLVVMATNAASTQIVVTGFVMEVEALPAYVAVGGR